MVHMPRYKCMIGCCTCFRPPRLTCVNGLCQDPTSTMVSGILASPLSCARRHADCRILVLMRSLSLWVITKNTIPNCTSQYKYKRSSWQNASLAGVKPTRQVVRTTSPYLDSALHISATVALLCGPVILCRCPPCRIAAVSFTAFLPEVPDCATLGTAGFNGRHQ